MQTLACSLILSSTDYYNAQDNLMLAAATQLALSAGRAEDLGLLDGSDQ